MKALNLDLLNINSPYSVWNVGKYGYGFKTKYGVLFRIVIAPDETIWENGAYEFSIINENSLISPNDQDVQLTIVAIIEEFFRNNPDILLYQCETGDNKQAARERLFLKWFPNYSSGRYAINATDIEAEGISNFAAVIVQRDNPQLKKILSDFDNFVGFFKDKPQ